MTRTSAPSTAAAASLGVRSFLTYFVPPVVTLGVLVAVVHVVDRGSEWRLRREQATNLVGLQRETLLAEFDSIESDVLFLAQEERLLEFASGSASARESIELEYRHFCSVKRRYDQIRYLDTKGVEQIRVNFAGGNPVAVPPEELQAKTGRYYVDAAMALPAGKVYVSPFDLNVEHGRIEEPRKPVIRFATPVFDREGRKRGILVLNYLGGRLLSHLSDLAASFGGSSMLVDADGHWLAGSDATDGQSLALGADRSFSDEHEDAWTRITSESRGVARTAEGIYGFETIDSQNPLHFVAHAPSEEISKRPALVLKRLLLVYGVMVGLVGTLALFLARAAALRRSQEATIRDSEARLRALTTRLLDAQEDERRAIARDLHDDLGQLVTATTLDLQRAQHEPSDERRSGAIRHALASSEMLLARVHEIATRLRPTLLDDLGLRDALQSLAAEFESARDVSVRTRIPDTRLDLPAEVSQNLFRIVQEALTNVSRHAEANEVEIRVERASDHVFLRIEDDGKGFDVGAMPQGRLGVLGMRERAELLDGSFRIESAPGSGTSIEVRVPLANEARASAEGNEE